MEISSIKLCIAKDLWVKFRIPKMSRKVTQVFGEGREASKYYEMLLEYEGNKLSQPLNVSGNGIWVFHLMNMNGMRYAAPPE